jgi:hypothetical protein
MNIDRKTLTRAGVAGGVSLALLLLVILFVGVQAPEASAPAAEPPPIALAGVGEEPPATPEEESAESAASAAAPEEKKAEAPAEAAKKTSSMTIASSSAPKAAAPAAPARAQVSPQPAPAARSYSGTPVGDEGLKVKFKTVADLAALVADSHVDIVLEYPDGSRYMLPRDLDLRAITFRVPDDHFMGWVSEGRVSELVPNQELMDHLGVHQSQLRYLAVLDSRLVGAIEAEARAAQVNPRRSVLLVERGPEVSVALARR